MRRKVKTLPPLFHLHILYVATLTGACNSKSISTLVLHVNGLLRMSLKRDPTDFKKHDRGCQEGRYKRCQHHIVAVLFKGCNLKVCDQRTPYQNVSHGKVCERCWVHQAITALRMTVEKHIIQWCGINLAS